MNFKAWFLQTGIQYLSLSDLEMICARLVAEAPHNNNDFQFDNLNGSNLKMKLLSMIQTSSNRGLYSLFVAIARQVSGGLDDAIHTEFEQVNYE